MWRLEMSNRNATRIIDEKTPLMYLAGPMFLEMLLNILINNIDTMMLGRYNDNSAGAVGVANQVMFFIILMFNIIATATSIVVAQYLGAEKYDEMNKIYTLAFGVNFFAGMVLSGGVMLLRGPVLSLIGVENAMLQDAKDYVLIVGGGLFLQGCYNVMLQILRCNGYPKVGMYISIAVNLVNIGGNWAFLYGPLKDMNMGVKGVAISTVTARIIALIASVIFFYAKRIGKLSIKYVIPFPGKLLWEMVKVGLPSAGENMSYNLYQIVLLSFITKMGENEVNAKVFCASLTSFAMVFSNTAALATQIIVGHLVGEGKEDAAYKRVFQTLKLTMPITIGLSVANWLLSPLTLRLFTDNEVIIKLGFYIMLVDVLIEIGRCLNMTFVNSLKAAGDYVYPLIVGFITMWGLGVTVGYGLGVWAGLGVAGVFLGTGTDEFIRGLIVMRRWYRKKWCGKAIVQSDKKEQEGL